MSNKKVTGFLDNIDRKDYRPKFGGLEILKYLGPGLLVTVGFIDPGNWASNLGAGAGFGYLLLWMVTFSTIMLIMLQHNVAHLGIATGLCLSEATTKFIRPVYSKTILTYCGTGFHIYFVSRDFRWRHCPEHAFQYPHSCRIGAGGSFCTDHALHQWLSNDRKMDHRFCFGDRSLLYLRACPWFRLIGTVRYIRGSLLPFRKGLW